MKRLLPITLIVLMITGCLPWVRTGGMFTAPAQNVTLDLPDGWMRKNTNEYVLVTRDGLALQYILVEQINVNDTLKYTKKKFRSGMLPQEMADVIIDNTTSNQDILNMKVVTNKPVKISNHSGFKAIYTYKSKDGLKYKSVYYGFMAGEWFYGVQYNAPERYYFKRNLKTFEKVVKSLKLTA